MLQKILSPKNSASAASNVLRTFKHMLHIHAYTADSKIGNSKISPYSRHSYQKKCLPLHGNGWFGCCFRCLIVILIPILAYLWERPSRRVRCRAFLVWQSEDMFVCRLRERDSLLRLKSIVCVAEVFLIVCKYQNKQFSCAHVLMQSKGQWVRDGAQCNAIQCNGM